MNKLPEMSSFLFSMSEAIEKLNCILVDSLILRMDFTVESVGRDLERSIDFSSEELCGQSLECICQNSKLPLLLKLKLRTGYFDNVNEYLLNRKGERIRVIISGFYLGLISDLNGYIVLKIRVLENASQVEKEVATEKSQIDSFIYRTAHDLRGPLATIKGLVNLLKGRKDNLEVDELTNLVELHANKLDDRLFKLLYMADMADAQEGSKGTVHFKELEREVRVLLQENCQLDKATLTFNAPKEVWHGVNEIHVHQLLKSTLLYIVSLPIASVHDQELKIEMNFSMGMQRVEIEISAFGFLASPHVQSLIQNSSSLYDDLLANPYLFNYYVAKKRAIQMEATMRIDFYNTSKQIIKLLLPKQAH